MSDVTRCPGCNAPVWPEHDALLAVLTTYASHLDHCDMRPNGIDGDCQCGLFSTLAFASRGPEGRAEGQSPAERPLTVTDEAKAESDPAVDLLRATVNRLMGERDALAGALRGFLAEFGDKATNANVRAARSALAQLDSVAPPLTPND